MPLMLEDLPGGCRPQDEEHEKENGRQEDMFVIPQRRSEECKEPTYENFEGSSNRPLTG
jgi:hypothetical protein